ncbi:hemolysin III family protein, partial [Mycobacterium tuberculosis]
MSGQADTATTAEARTPAHAAHHLVEGVARVLTKPRFRGWIHVYSAGTAVLAGASLVAVSWAVGSAKAGLTTLAYTAATITMFTVSATYHRVNWKSATARNWMKRADHSMIFVFIAGSYTPFALLALPAHDGRVVLSIVWGGAIAGILLKMCWPAAPRSVGVPLYLLLGWVAVWYTATILHNAGVTALVLLFVGGALYSIGGIL